MITDPLRESLIHLEALGLHPLGALVRTHIRQEERERALIGHVDQGVEANITDILKSMFLWKLIIV
jgi:hypothetical protein